MALGIKDNRVLVLNRLWQAVHICTVERAVALVFVGHARVVHEDDGAFQTFSFPEWTSVLPDPEAERIRTIALDIRPPQVIVLSHYDRFPRKEVRFSRQSVFERDKFTCQYCGRRLEGRLLNLDHVLPRHQGGHTNWENVVCSCLDCNRRKGNRTPEEAGMRLLRPPQRPRWRPLMQTNVPIDPEHLWRHFVDLSRWTVEMGAAAG